MRVFMCVVVSFFLLVDYLKADSDHWDLIVKFVTKNTAIKEQLKVIVLLPGEKNNSANQIVIDTQTIPEFKLLPQRQGIEWGIEKKPAENVIKSVTSQEFINQSRSDLNVPIDKHTWLDPENAKIVAKAIAKFLTEKYPENSSIFEKNLFEFESELNKTVSEIRSKLLGKLNRPFIVFTDSLQYFEKYFGLTGAAGAVLLNDKIKKHNVMTLFKNKEICCFISESKNINESLEMVKNTITKVAEINLENDTYSDEDGYFKLLKSIADKISDCLDSVAPAAVPAPAVPIPVPVPLPYQKQKK